MNDVQKAERAALVRWFGEVCIEPTENSARVLGTLRRASPDRAVGTMSARFHQLGWRPKLNAQGALVYEVRFGRDAQRLRHGRA